MKYLNFSFSELSYNINYINISPYLFDFYFMLPEIFFFIVFMVLIFFGSFYSNYNIFKYIKISKPIIILSIISLFLFIFLNLNSIDYNNIISIYFFVNNELTIFFKVFLSILSILLFFMFFNYILLFDIFVFEFFILFMFSIFGMFLVVTSYDFIVTYLTIEMQSLCFYILAAFNKKYNKSVEAGIKYYILGSFSSCILLLGISIIYGLTGLTNFKDLSVLLDLGLNSSILDYFFILGLILINIGFFFKLAVAPFHFWLPDVFDGSVRLVVSIFSILPKISILFLVFKVYNVILIKILIDWQFFFIIFILLSWIVGIIGGLNANRLHKLIAYSAINHIGFLLFIILLNNIECLIIYLIIYTFILLNVFGIIFSLITQSNNKDLNLINQLIYLKKSNFMLTFSFIICFFSLAGIPPLSGFFGKFFIFLYALNLNLYFLVSIGLVLSIVSCFYYLRIIKIITFNNTNNWIFLYSLNKNISYIISFGLFFNIFFIFLLPFIFELSKFLFLSSFF